MNDLRARAERFVRSPAHLGDLALAFDATTATTVDVHVAGRACFSLILDDIENAKSSVHLEAWSLKRFFELGVRVRSRELATRFDERFSAPAEAVSTPASAPEGIGPRLEAAAFAAVSPLL